jgi:hypothetical protein
VRRLEPILNSWRTYDGKREALARALVASEGFSWKRAELEAKAFMYLCHLHDVDALLAHLETGQPTLWRYAADTLAEHDDMVDLPRPAQEGTTEGDNLPTPVPAPEGKAPRKTWWKWWIR